MTKTKHTPGPWYFGIPSGTGNPFVQRGRSGGFTVVAFDVESAIADARLIAAAPELLEALKSAREELEQIAMAEIGEPYNNLQINAAITKAEGGE